MIRHFATLLLITFSLSAVAQTEISVDGLNYSLSDDGTATVTGYDTDADTVNVPATVKYGSKEFRVAAIADGAFNDGNLTCISIPESVISIGESVFNVQYSTPQLTSINVDENNPVYDSRNNCNAIIETATNKLIRGCHKTIIPKGVTIIGKNAFFGCDSIESIDIQQGVTAIEESAFAECDNLASVTLPDGLITIGDRAFQASGHGDPEYTSSLESIRMPESVTSIGKYAFEGCVRLHRITIPQGVATIEEGTFYRCCGLEEVIFPDGLKTIGADAFRECYGLKEAIFPKGLTTIGKYAFADCNLTKVALPEGLKTISAGTFYNCSLTSIDIPESVTTIEGEAFCTSWLTTIHIPKSVTSISADAFSPHVDDMDSEVAPSILKSITVDEDNPVYDSRNNCNAIIETATNKLIIGCPKTVIPEDVAEIGAGAFCTSWLTTIHIPKSVTHIAANAFSPYVVDYVFSSHCILESIIVDADNPVYDSRNNCNAIIETATNKLIIGCQNSIIPEGITEIGDSAFFGVSNLAEISIPEGLTTIGYGALGGCSSLTSIHIPKSVTTIGDYAFSGCENLKTIYCHVPTPIPLEYPYMFYGCKIYVPDEYVEAYKAAEEWSMLDIQPISKAPVTIAIAGEKYILSEDGTATVCGAVNKTYVDIPATIEYNSKTFDVTTIEHSAFAGCTNLKTINCHVPTPIPLEYPDIFYGCKIYVPDESVEAYKAAEGWRWHTILPMPIKTVTDNEVRYSLLKDGTAIVEGPVKTDIKNVVIPKQIEYDSHTYKVTTIVNEAFRGCSSLTSISIPKGVTAIDSWTFRGCSSLTSISIPKGVTTIGYEAFYGCSSLTSISIPEGVTAIDSWTFRGCSSLTSISIPKSVTAIDYYAFALCYNLKTIYCHAPVPVEYTMWEISDCTIYVPDKSVDVYKAAEGWKGHNILPMSQAPKKH